MSRLSSILYGILYLGIFTGCFPDEKFPLDKEYPIIETNPVIHLDNSGVTFSAEIISIGSTEIIDYGFLWEGNGYSYKYSFHPENVFNPFEQNKLIDPLKLNPYEVRITSDLATNVEYSYRSFVLISEFMVLGNTEKFTSLGSLTPEFLDFYPREGDSNDTITLTGKNFSLSGKRLEVKFGADKARILYSNMDTIICILPEYISRSGNVTIHVTSGDHVLESKDFFSIDGHRILDINPKKGIIGETEFLISGTGFSYNADSNWVFIIHESRITEFFNTTDYRRCKILEADHNELKIKLPNQLDPGKSRVALSIGGKFHISEKSIEIITRWKKMKSFPGDGRVAGYFTTMDDRGYLICGSGEPECCGKDISEVWEYDILMDEWSQLTDFPGGERSLGTGFNLNGKIFYGMGIHDFGIYNDFWEFDPENESWKRLSDFPGNGNYDAICFSLKNEGYMVGGMATGINDEVWNYQFEDDSWTYMGKIPSIYVYKVDGRSPNFEYNGSGYIIPFIFNYGNSYKLLEFNPDKAGYFTEITEFPYGYRDDRMIRFVLDDQLYIGGYFTKEFYKYDFTSNSWMRIESYMGVPSRYITSFSYNGDRGFAMFGMIQITPNIANYETLEDIWMYDAGIALD